MKKVVTLSLCLVLSLLFAACSPAGNNKAASNESGVSEQDAPKESLKTIEDMKGVVEIPENPQRIVDVAGLTDELIILDMPIVGSANTSMFDGTSVPTYLQEYFSEHGVETVGNYSGGTATGDLNLEKIADLKPDLIIMNIRHEKVHEQLKDIAPTAMINDTMDYVNWRGRFEQLGEWFSKEDKVTKWLSDFDAKASELSKKVKDKVGDSTFAVIESNSVHFGSYYVYRSGGPGELIYDELKLTPSLGVPEGVWGEVVDSEYFSKINADYLFFFSDDGQVGETADNAAWQSIPAVRNGKVFHGDNETQYDMAYTANGKLLYMEKLANAILNGTDVK